MEECSSEAERKVVGRNPQECYSADPSGRPARVDSRQYFSATNFIPFSDWRSSYLCLSDRLGSFTFGRDTFSSGMRLRIWEIQLSRARRLSSECTRYQGACLVSAVFSIM